MHWYGPNDVFVELCYHANDSFAKKKETDKKTDRKKETNKKKETEKRKRRSRFAFLEEKRDSNARL